ncbi:MAG: hypothetical protein AMS24_03885 [Chlamydiae bacterium SM23_39]|nr:MAG: hypothetical protein AMS24_03885 [Chlamydiae bacterium SM23_39]
MKKIFFSICLLIFIVESKYFLTSGFNIKKIFYNPDFRRDLEINEDFSKYLPILNQKFFYLSKGRQCFVFESEDKKYVLKFIRYHKYRYPLWAEILSYLKILSKNQISLLKEKKERYERAMNSYKIAYEDLKDITKVVYIHLNQTDFLKKKVVIRDSLKIDHEVELDKVGFILQKKENNLKDVFFKFNDENNKKIIKSFFGSISYMLRKNITNIDILNLIRNSGCENNDFVIIDVGSFLKNSDKKILRKTFFKCSYELEKFLREKGDRYLPFFEEVKRKEIVWLEK